MFQEGAPDLQTQRNLIIKIRDIYYSKQAYFSRLARGLLRGLL